MAPAINSNSISQNLPSRNSSKSDRTLMDGAAMAQAGEEEKVLSESSSQRSSRVAKRESDLEAQSPFDIPLKTENAGEEQDPYLVCPSLTTIFKQLTSSGHVHWS
jgi:hypothetical protein